jgi:hypothetical protein
MRIILLLAVLAIASPAIPEDAEPPKRAYNQNDYSWEAKSKSKDGAAFDGKGEASNVRRAWRQTKKEINAMARAGKAKDKEKFVVTLEWRGRKYVRDVVAHSDHGPWPIEMDE